MARTPRKVLKGERLGRWLVISDMFRVGKKMRCRCRCECGGEYEVGSYSLAVGTSTQCKPCALHENQQGKVTHGATRGAAPTPEYRCWASMMNRCGNENDPNYHHYGGRGIRVCDAWHNFKNFISDMGPRPHAKATLEREDNSKGYGPGNCVWATMKQQGRNKRNNRIVRFQGADMPLSQAVEIAFPTGGEAAYFKVHQRITRHGWDAERALNTP